MNRSTSFEGPEDRWLLRLMQRHGDAVLRTCCLLCGDLPQARWAAHAVFLAASAQPAAFMGLTERETLCRLLALTMRHCPCPALGRLLRRSVAFSQLLFLPPLRRRIAVLCLYHDLSPAEAAAALDIDSQRAVRLLNQACAQLKKP